METIVTLTADECEWFEPPGRGGLRWKYLVDSTKMASHGLSAGIVQLPPGVEMTLHHHAPQEIYVVRSGSGVLLKDNDQTEPVGKDSIVYLPENAKHGLKNTGEDVLEVLWVFPTDCWEEIVYFREQPLDHVML